jgi:transcriptional regulator with XRE-family HTH domain
MAKTSRSAVVRELGVELRQARESAGLGQRALAQRADISAHSRISEAESGKRLLSVDELERIFDALGVSTDERDRLLGLARSAKGPGQLNIGSASIARALTELIDHEQHATRITNVSPLLIPGLLQTSDYARAIVGDKPDAETRVKLRAGRRDILTRRNPVELIAVIDSEALVRPIAPPDVMTDQLRHIRSLAELPNVTIQVVSSTRPGYHPMLAGPFELIEFAKAGPIVHLEHRRSSVSLWQDDEVASYVEAADYLRHEVAMTAEQSTEVIAGIINGMEKE